MNIRVDGSSTEDRDWQPEKASLATLTVPSGMRTDATVDPEKAPWPTEITATGPSEEWTDSGTSTDSDAWTTLTRVAPYSSMENSIPSSVTVSFISIDPPQKGCRSA